MQAIQLETEFASHTDEIDCGGRFKANNLPVARKGQGGFAARPTAWRLGGLA